ncbi:Transcriptional regulator, TetR family [Pseudonocardia sp. Ae168_Ps1]|uniref:TetR/AcrR family transcriptional regulator n=1 Tax=unclassified Pseudonocardia TaxID=2619320 RepID=UPI00094AF18C|nr:MULTISPECIES: TetR/AcrR family transcriptional regulator [unclassified Pseudonocardia]OLL72758.1 Transcriptional regulator, TetR family [Pseudonocardia sp. Ae150A_Ps1]OLL78731.1 Transcriptional regulator, TetR family [Pseudonocardia sp. Ae168_Ps1]OLL87141.1 Transcriptional regulator, TetR family [Pseudonocardia sp. Ae263_Ps1]OLL92829.1 Transcriptional regulator, TetR family [Pseudonocardia sp. Ae356_Ps1]
MPKVLGSLATHREQVRERVFAALREQLYERGFEQVTLSGVAAAAGVGRSAMYNHFPDRQALLVAFVEHEAARYVEDLDAALAGVSSPAERLAVFARMQLRRLAEFHLPPGQALAGALDPQAYRRIAAHADPIGDRLTAILRDGAADGSMVGDDPAVLAALVAAALSSRKIVDVAPPQLEATVDTAVAAVLRMVSTTTHD